MSFKFTKSNLNFDVYTAASKPTTPGANNDIAIITSIPMPNWIMSPDGPSGIPRSDGDVWIQYSVSGDTFNALKNNSMMIATIKAWQYVDGAWAEVEAVSCQNGEWVYWWNGEIYEQGNLYEDITGGWVMRNDSGGNGTITADKVIQLRYKSGASSSQHSTAYTNKKIDLTKYTKLTMEVNVISVGSSSMDTSVCICNTNTAGYPITDRVAYEHTPTGSTGTFTVELDVTSYNSEYYIAAWGMYCNADVIEIKLS